MRIFLLISAWLLIIIGATIGAAFVGLVSLAVLQEELNWHVLAFLPVFAFSALALLIGFRYIKRRDSESAEGIAAMAGLATWLALQSATMRFLASNDQWFLPALFAQILISIFVYKLIQLGVRHKWDRKHA